MRVEACVCNPRLSFCDDNDDPESIEEYQPHSPTRDLEKEEEKNRILSKKVSVCGF